MMKRKLVICLIVLIVLSMMFISSLLYQSVFSAEQVKLTYSTWDKGEAIWPWYEQAFEDFENRYPNVEIEVEYIPPSDYINTTMMYFAAGMGPDIYRLYSQQIRTVVKEGFLEPLDDYLEGTDILERSSKLLRESQIDGKYWALLNNATPQTLNVNMKLLREAGIDSPPSNVEEFVDAAIKVKEETGKWGYVPYTDRAGEAFSYRTLAQWALGFGTDLGEPGRITIDVPEVREALKWLMIMVEEGAAPLGINHTDGRKMFSQGETAMLIDGVWVIHNTRDENPDLYQEMTLVKPPFPTHNALTGGGWQGINSASKNKEYAWKFLELLCEPERQAKYVEMLEGRPGATTDRPSEEIIQTFPDYVNILWDTMENNVVQLGYVPPGFEDHEVEFRKELVPYYVDILEGRKSIEEGLREAQMHMEDWAVEKGILEWRKIY